MSSVVFQLIIIFINNILNFTNKKNKMIETIFDLNILYFFFLQIEVPLHSKRLILMLVFLIIQKYTQSYCAEEYLVAKYHYL